MIGVSLFSGIGGFDLAFEHVFGTAVDRCGHLATQAELDPHCRKVLKNRWPEALLFADVMHIPGEQLFCDIMFGGDPCQENSIARSNGNTAHPSLGDKFIGCIALGSPRWVVRENPLRVRKDAPWPAERFAGALETLGYSCAILELSSAAFTAQSRPRAFVVGCVEPGPFRRLLDQCAEHRGDFPPHGGERPLLACLTTHPTRMDSRDNYIREADGRLRILGPAERLAAQGFPGCWLDGFNFSNRTVARMAGNAVSVPVAQWIFERIAHADQA